MAFYHASRGLEVRFTLPLPQDVQVRSFRKKNIKTVFKTKFLFPSFGRYETFHVYKVNLRQVKVCQKERLGLLKKNLKL